MLIDERTRKAAVTLGKRRLEAVVVDPASNWPLLRRRPASLISKDKVAVSGRCGHTV